MFRAKIDLNNSQFLMPITPKKLAFTRNYRHNYSLAGGNKDTSKLSVHAMRPTLSREYQKGRGGIQPLGSHGLCCVALVEAP